MELSTIWYAAAIIANMAVIILAFYIAALFTALSIERRIARREQEKREMRHNWYGRRGR